MLYEHRHKMILRDISASILFLTFMIWVNQWLSIAKRTEQNNDGIHGRLDRDDRSTNIYAQVHIFSAFYYDTIYLVKNIFMP